MTFHKQSEIFFDSQKVAEDSVGPNKNVSEDRDIRSWRFCAAATSQIPFNYGKVVSLPKKKKQVNFGCRSYTIYTLQELDCDQSVCIAA